MTSPNFPTHADTERGADETGEKITSSEFPYQQLEVGDQLTLSCQSRKGTPGIIMLDVTGIHEIDYSQRLTVVTVSYNSSRSPVQPGERYYLGHSTKKPEGENAVASDRLAAGTFLWLYPEEISDQQIRTSRIRQVNIRRPGEDGLGLTATIKEPWRTSAARAAATAGRNLVSHVFEPSHR